MNEIYGTKEIEDILAEADIDDNGGAEQVEVSETDTEHVTNKEVSNEDNSTDSDNDISDDKDISSNTDNISNTNKDIEDTSIEDMDDEAFQQLLRDVEKSNEEVSDDINEKVSDDEIRIALAEKDGTIRTLANKLDSYISENAELKIANAELEMYNGSPVRGIVAKINGGDENLKKEFIEAARKFMSDLEIDEEVNSVSKSNKVKGGKTPSEDLEIENYESVTIL